MADYDRTPFEYLSIAPYGLLDSIAAGFEGGLHPELRRLMQECKAASLRLQCANIVKFPSPQNVAGSAPARTVDLSQVQAENVTVVDFAASSAKAGVKKAAPK